MLYVFAAALIQLLMSTMPSASKIVIAYLPVEFYIAVRWTTAGLIFGLLSLTIKNRPPLKFKLVRKTALLGIGGYSIASLGTLYGLKIGGVTFFSLLSLCSPIFVIFMSLLILQEKLARTTAIAGVIALCGIALTVSGKIAISTTENALMATSLVGCAYLLESLVFLSSKKLKKEIALLQYMFIAETSGGLFMFAVLAVLRPEIQWAAVPLKAWLCLGYVAFVSCVFCSLCWYWLLNHLRGQQMAFLTYFHGISAAVLGIILFGEPYSANMFLGSLLLFISILVASYRPGRLIDRFRRGKLDQKGHETR